MNRDTTHDEPDKTDENNAADMVDKTHTPEPMEVWMNTWLDTETPEELTRLRETFATAQWRQRSKDVLTLGVGALVAGACATILATTALLLEAIAAALGLLVMLTYAWRRYQRMAQERVALPLSPGDYLAATRHNIALRLRENRLLRRTSALVLPAILALNLWAAYEGWQIYLASGGLIGVAAMVGIVLLALAAWRIYVRAPRKLRNELAALESLESELSLEDFTR